MQIQGKQYRSIWREGNAVKIIDQTKLPFEFSVETLNDLEQACHAISSMQVRGAPLIGATAAYGIALALTHDSDDATLCHASKQLLSTRPTAVNLQWALEYCQGQLLELTPSERPKRAWQLAEEICEQDILTNQSIGNHGLALIENLLKQKPGTVFNILTHCNAGALATVDWGTALAPIYTAHNKGLAIHVWVDETRPRNQGASLTAWELSQHGVPHTLISDNSGGHLMQQGNVDLCLVGSDRTTATGDVCNKIGTYLKALAAKDNQVPFYACVPSSTIDWTMQDGLQEIPIEERDSKELTHINGVNAQGILQTVRVTPENCPAANHAFDVTPSRLVTGIITEHGTYEANDLHQLKRQLHHDRN